MLEIIWHAVDNGTMIQNVFSHSETHVVMVETASRWPRAVEPIVEAAASTYQHVVADTSTRSRITHLIDL